MLSSLYGNIIYLEVRIKKQVYILPIRKKRKFSKFKSNPKGDFPKVNLKPEAFKRSIMLIDC